MVSGGWFGLNGEGCAHPDRYLATSSNSLRIFPRSSSCSSVDCRTSASVISRHQRSVSRRFLCKSNLLATNVWLPKKSLASSTTSRRSSSTQLATLFSASARPSQSARLHDENIYFESVSVSQCMTRRRRRRPSSTAGTAGSAGGDGDGAAWAALTSRRGRSSIGQRH